MTKNEILAVAYEVDRAYPGLKNSNRWEWNHKVALICYLHDNTVGQKSTNFSSPISDDTIGICDISVIGELGSSFQIPFLAVDLVNGTTGEIQWLEHGWTTSQVFHIPTPADILNAVIVPSVPTQPANMVPYHHYDGDEFWHDKIGKILYWDYTDKTRANRPGLDSKSSVWFSRTMHDCTMGETPNGPILTPEASIDKHRTEWCAGLGIPVVPFPENL